MIVHRNWRLLGRTDARDALHYLSDFLDRERARAKAQLLVERDLDTYLETAVVWTGDGRPPGDAPLAERFRRDAPNPTPWGSRRAPRPTIPLGPT